LFSSPAPAATPAPSHQRCRWRNTAVVTHSRTAAQASRSSGVVLPMCGADDDGSARRGEGGEYPAEPARAEQRRELGRRDHDGPAGQRRDYPDRRRADAENVRDPGEQRDQRRLVHVTETEMVPRHDEVQLVLLEAVPAAHRELDRYKPGADHPSERRNAVGGGLWCLRYRCDRRAGCRNGGGGVVGLVHDDASRGVHRAGLANWRTRALAGP